MFTMQDLQDAYLLGYERSEKDYGAGLNCNDGRYLANMARDLAEYATKELKEDNQ